VVAVPGDAEAEALIRRLRGEGYDVTALIEQDAAERLATVRLRPDADPGAPVVDLLFASSGIESEIVRDAESVEVLPGLPEEIARAGEAAEAIIARGYHRGRDLSADLDALRAH